MPRIRFEPSGLEIDAPGGEALVDVVDELPGTSVLLACRAAHCGACRVRVEAGATALVPAAGHELETLALLASLPDQRLACQLRLTRDASEAVVLRVLR